MTDVLIIKFIAGILLVTAVYTISFWCGYEKGVRDTEVSRKEEQKITEQKKGKEMPPEFSPEARALYEEIMRGACVNDKSSKGKGSFTATLSPQMEEYNQFDRRS